jgi:hypothetical protein
MLDPIAPSVEQFYFGCLGSKRRCAASAAIKNLSAPFADIPKAEE